MPLRPWMPLYIADYRAKTVHLSAAQHGAYLLLIMHYWLSGGLPDDDAQLARIACMSPSEWKRARPVIEPFFLPGWRHKRVDEEVGKAEKLSVGAKERAILAAQARWNGHARSTKGPFSEDA